jgi:hypothetical protein
LALAALGRAPADPTEQTAGAFLTAQEFVRYSTYAAAHHEHRTSLQMHSIFPGTALRRKRLPEERHRNWNMKDESHGKP